MPAEHGADERAAASDRPHAHGLSTLERARDNFRERMNRQQA